jgi:hypothetical protein
VIWIGLLLFFLVVPAVAAYQSGRIALFLPALLVLVCIQWAAVGESRYASTGLALSIAGLALAAYTGELGRRRRTGR